MATEVSSQDDSKANIRALIVISFVELCPE